MGLPMSSTDHLPGRPLGLSLAIALSVMLYALLPTVLLGYRLFVQDRLSRIDTPVLFEGQEYEALASGGSFYLSPVELVVQGTAIALFVFAAALAWRGGRSWIRPMFTSVVLVYAGLTAFVALRGLLAPASAGAGVTSLDSLVRQGLCGVLVTTVLIPAYVVWYINRAPARAFYAGRDADSAADPRGDRAADAGT